jgi:hypothetical protein
MVALRDNVQNERNIIFSEEFYNAVLEVCLESLSPGYVAFNFSCSSLR